MKSTNVFLSWSEFDEFPIDFGADPDDPDPDAYIVIIEHFCKYIFIAYFILSFYRY